MGRIVEILRRNGWYGREWGIRAKISRELGVSRATIARDLQNIERAMLDPAYVKAGTILDDIDRFDAAFFGFTPREAEIMKLRSKSNRS